jgi:hypothetical protein
MNNHKETRLTRWSQVDGVVLADVLFEKEKEQIALARMEGRKYSRLYTVLAYAYLNRGLTEAPFISMTSPFMLLSDELDCSRQTIRRHLNTLRRLDYPLSRAEVVFKKRLQSIGVTLKDITNFLGKEKSDYITR